MVDLMTPNGSHGEAVCLYKVGLELAKVLLTSFIEEQAFEISFISPSTLLKKKQSSLLMSVK